MKPVLSTVLGEPPGGCRGGTQPGPQKPGQGGGASLRPHSPAPAHLLKAAGWGEGRALPSASSGFKSDFAVTSPLCYNTGGRFAS